MDYKEIAKNYINGWFFIDLIAVLPFELILKEQAKISKLLRLFRLPRLFKLFDIRKFKKLMRSLMKNSQDERIGVQQQIEYVYKIFMLIIKAAIITYFVGCFWYMIIFFLNEGPQDQNK
jgi:hypothetical protein